MDKRVLAFTILAVNLLATVTIAAPGRRGAPEFVPQLTEDKLTRVDFIRYADCHARKPCIVDGFCAPDEGPWCVDCKKNGDEEPEPSGCYDFLSGSKPKWNQPENYYYDDLTVGSYSDSAADKWEFPVSTEIFDQGLMGAGPWGVYDYKNSLVYGDYPEPGVVGVTRIWYRGKNIYEYDIMYDEHYLPSMLDLETVVLHEMGHAAGLGDLYDVVCSDEVMYWSISIGETRTVLGEGDITGIYTLYGP